MDYAAMAWRRKWVIISFFLLGAYASLVVSSRLPTMFQSEMLIQVVPQRVPDAYVKSTVTMRTVDRLSALSEQIMSRTELERLVIEMNLYSDERSRLPMQDVVDEMRARIRVEPVMGGGGLQRDADSFYVRFSYPEPAMARRVTERLGGLFIDVNARDRGNLAQATNSFLQTQLEDARGRLQQQEEKLRHFRELNAGRLPTQLDFNMQAMQNTQMRVQALVEQIARDRDRKLMLERLHADAQAEIITPPPVPQPAAPQNQPQQQGAGTIVGGSTRQNLETARQVLSAFELRLKPEHPDIIRTKALVAKLEAQLADEDKKAAEAAAAGTPVETAVVASPQEVARRDRLQQMRADIESLDRQITFKEAEEQRIRGSVEDLQRRIEQVPGVESEWIALTRDYDTQQQAYKELLTKSEDAKLAADLEQRQIGEQFRILDPARAPVRPTGVNRLEVNGIGAGIGLGLGVLLAALLELKDRTFRHADDIVEVFKLPVIAMVPRVVTKAERQRARLRTWMVSAAAAVVVLAAGYGFWAMQLWKFIT